VRTPTTRDVAVLASVRLKTVSRVVNGEPGVSPATAARIRDAGSRGSGSSTPPGKTAT